jgi:hypothetical protein
MESPEPIQRFLFLAPFLLVPLILVLVKFPWRMIVPVWLAGTLIQEMIFALYPRANPLSQRLLAALYLYPFALFPLGLWSAILGIACWAIAVRMGWPLELQKSRQLLLGLCWGALIGVIFSFAIGQVEELGPISGQICLWLLWEAGGAIAGAADGVIIAAFLPAADTGPINPLVERLS